MPDLGEITLNLTLHVKLNFEQIRFQRNLGNFQQKCEIMLIFSQNLFLFRPNFTFSVRFLLKTGYLVHKFHAGGSIVALAIIYKITQAKCLRLLYTLFSTKKHPL